MDIRGALAELRDLELWRLDELELAGVITDVHALMTVAESVLTAAAAELESRGTARRWGVSSTRRLLADLTRVNPGRAGGWTELGVWLGAHPRVAAALRSGVISVEHARIIVAVLADLPGDLPVEAADACEAFLLDAATVDDPNGLRRRGLELVDRLRPEAAEDLEEQAVRRRELCIGNPVDGRVSLRGWLDTEAAELLRSALSPMAAPRPAVDGELDSRAPARRNADALVDLVKRAVEHQCVPGEGYSRPHITLTVDVDDLTEPGGAGPGAAGAAADDVHTGGAGPGGQAQPGPDAGGGAGGGGARSTAHPTRPPRAARMARLTFLGPLSRAAARRLACDAEITAITMDEYLVPLDVGRSTYVVDGGIRRALIARDNGCAFPGCGRPPTWCEAHHIRHWADGGPTALTNLVLLCGFHHRRVHHDGWTAALGLDKQPWFTPPAWVDPRREPRPAHSRQPRPPLPDVA